MIPCASPAAITVLVHTRNEAVWLPGCLESLGWADELVVADMASTDETRTIARAAGARVLEVPVAEVVEPARNAAVTQCAGPWVLVVDADERVPATLAARLREIAAAPDSAAEAFALPRRNLFLGVWLEHSFWPDRQVRFFKKGAVRWSDFVHEPPRVERGRLAELPASADLALEHPGYGADLGRFIRKLAHYAPLDARRLAATENPPVWPWLLRRPASEFLGRYFRDGAWRHGMHGLAWSLLQGCYQLLVAVHLWALRLEPAAAGIEKSASNANAAAALRRRVRWETVRLLLKTLLPPRAR